MAKQNFVHLHFHTSYSFLDGYNPVKKAVARLKELGFSSCAITDHGTLAGCWEFQEECLKQGIKPLLGNELYFTLDTSELTKPLDKRREEAMQRAVAAGALPEEHSKMTKKAITEAIEPYKYDTKDYHILFIAKNQKGWHNLIKLSSEASRIGTFNGRPHVDFNLIEKYHEDLICTTACIASYPSYQIQQGNYEQADWYLNKMRAIFQDDFYLEIQPLAIYKQHVTNLYYMEYAKKNNVKTIATNDVHWTNEDDADDHDTLLCVGLKTWKTNPNRMRYSPEFWIKTEEEIKHSFLEQDSHMSSNTEKYPDIEEVPLLEYDSEEYRAYAHQAIEETTRLAKKVSQDIKLHPDRILFPKFDTPHGLNEEQLFNMKAWRGLYKYLSQHKELDRNKYEHRLAEELRIINKKGYANYFLVVQEYVQWSNDNGVPTGPGRGSAAGSLALFCLGVTKNVDPIKYNLLFSRFMTEEREASPDIDTDLSWDGRDRTIQHLSDKYGEAQVAHVGTFSYLGVKSSIKDVCRALNYRPEQSDAITKEIDKLTEGDPAFTFAKADAWKEENPQKWELWNKLESQHQQAFSLCRKFEGIPRQFGVHASAIMIMPSPVTDWIPCRYVDGVGAVTLYNGDQVAYCAEKYDCLGLKTITILNKTINLINPRWTMEDLYEKADIHDASIYKYIQSCQTDAIFQLSSDMMKGLIKDIKPTTFEDLSAINALGRPGPLGSGQNKKYSDVKNKDKKPEYPIRDCEDILDRTFGAPVYQEQIMNISKKVSGFSDGQADIISRRIMCKKIVKEFPMMKRCHIYGKRNIEGPPGWEEDDNAPWYDPEGKFGGEIPGALANGYTKGEMEAYFDSIVNFTQYAFNFSHALCYAYIGYLCAWLKYYYPSQFMAAALTMASEDDKKELLPVLREMDISVLPPDINRSNKDYTPIDDKTILYGLGAVKGISDSTLPAILENRPYKSIEDAAERLSKQELKKNVAENLIKAGAFSFEDENRQNILNKFYVARKQKVKVNGKNVDLILDEEYNDSVIMRYEEESMGTHVTVFDWYEGLENGAPAQIEQATIIRVQEHTDKKGGLMAFVNFEKDGVKFEGVIFASKYKFLHFKFYEREGSKIDLFGKKMKNSFIIDDAR
jgi:DNA polymerase III, alpha subunit